MTDADHPAELIAFIGDLSQARREAGSPSYALLARLAAELHSGQRPGGVRYMALPRSTTSEILSGHRKHALKWAWVVTYVSALRLAAQRGGIDPDVVGTNEEWKQKYDAMLAAQQTRRRRPRPHGTHGGADATDRALAAGSVPGGGADAEAFLMMVRRSEPKGRHSRQDITPDWLEQYRALESLARVVRTYQTAVIPTLLQTEAYAQAVSGQRQHGRRRRCRLWAIVEEEAFRNQQIDREVMRAQVEHLIDLADEADIALQIVPTSTAGNPTRSEPMTIFRFPEPHMGDVVFLHQPSQPLFLFQQEDAHLYNQLFVSLTYTASKPADAKQALTAILSKM